MPTNSQRTSYFGPHVSYRTTKGHESGYVHVHVPSYGTFETDGLLQSDGTLDVTAQAGLKFSTITTVAPTTTIVPAGFFSLVSQSGVSLVIAYNSGGTLYTFTNAAAE